MKISVGLVLEMAALLLPGLPQRLYSQAVYGGIVGTATDPSDAAVTQVRVDAEFAHAGAMVASSQTTSGANQIHGSLLRNDKQVALKESATLQFRAEAFDFFNHTNLGQPTVCVDCPRTADRMFGAAATYLPRTWQVAAKVQF